MTPRTPRQWTEADIVDWPKDHPDVKDRRGTTWRWYPERDFYVTDWNEAASWMQLCKNLGPLSEVLPETPEPPQVGCCGACSGKGGVQGEACSDCLGSGHAHDPDDPCPTPEPPREDRAHLTTGELIATPLAHRCSGCDGTNTTYQSFSGGREYYCEDCEDVFPYADGDAPRRVQMLADGRHEELRAEMGGNFYAPVPASQSVPAVPVSSTGGKETGEAAETATEALNARKILLQLLQQVHDAATDDEPLNLRDAADRFLAGWRPTPPDSETEWGIRPVGQGDVEETGTEEWARSVAARMPALYVAVSRRLAGPWVEVTS